MDEIYEVKELEFLKINEWSLQSYRTEVNKVTGIKFAKL